VLRSRSNSVNQALKAAADDLFDSSHRLLLPSELTRGNVCWETDSDREAVIQLVFESVCNRCESGRPPQA